MANDTTIWNYIVIIALGAGVAALGANELYRSGYFPGGANQQQVTQPTSILRDLHEDTVYDRASFGWPQSKQIENKEDAPDEEADKLQPSDRERLQKLINKFVP